MVGRLMSDPAPLLAPGVVIAETYEIERQLGRGGMGEVWGAQRDDGAFGGRAAIKVLRAGMDSQRVLERLALEQRALARLNHPHIARLLDAGHIADGLPFIVMEVVAGGATATWQAVVAQQQRDLAERRFDDVRRFARTMLFEVDTALRDGPTADREKLVATALQYLDGLSAERLTDADLLRDVAEAYERVGDIQGNTMQANLGRPDDARRSFDKALVLREAQARLAPDDLKNVQGLFTIQKRLGDQGRAAGDLPAAARHHGGALRHATTPASARLDESDRGLARQHLLQGQPGETLRRTAPAEAATLQQLGLARLQALRAAGHLPRTVQWPAG